MADADVLVMKTSPSWLLSALGGGGVPGVRDSSSKQSVNERVNMAAAAARSTRKPPETPPRSSGRRVDPL